MVGKGETTSLAGPRRRVSSPAMESGTTRQRETEMKWALRVDDHRRLRERLGRLLGPPTVLDQRNRFYDTDAEDLRRAGASLRLRRENRTVLMTLKRRAAAASGGVQQHWETEREVSIACWPYVESDDVGAFMPLPEEVRELAGGRTLRCLGGFDNLRLRYLHEDGECCLDRSIFPGGHVDHELELESPHLDRCLDRWHERLRRWGIDPVPQPETKLERFLEAEGRRLKAGG